MRHNNKIISALLIIFFILIIGSFALGWFNNGINAIDLVGVLSSVAATILTAYTLVNNDKQLALTEAQLKEMEKSTEFSAQPLPVVSIERVYFEKPRAFYTPPMDEYSAYSRLFAKFVVQNYGAQPATNTIISGYVAIRNGDKRKFYDSTSKQFNTLGASDSEGKMSSDKSDFMFITTNDLSILSSIREMEYDNAPLLVITALYKNILGGCFFEIWQYKIFLKSKKDETTLRNWHSKMASFHIDYDSELKTLKKQRKSDNPRWNAQFEKMQASFADSTEQREVDLSYSLLPDSYKIKSISREEYDKRASKVYFGKPIPSWLNECVSLPEKSNE